MDMQREAIDYRMLTQRQQATWASGDFHELARQVMSVSESLCRAVDPHAQERVLDLCCGSGNAALVAARRYCEVVGVDYVPALLERARQRAAAEGVAIDFQLGDAQAMPYGDASFDVILSVFGVMFAPDQQRAAQEMLRVCRPGGRIGLCNWMPEGLGGELFRAHARYVPPPAGVSPPVRWGTDPGVAELLGAGVDSVTSEQRTFFQYYRSVEQAVDVFRTYFGPTVRALQALDADGQARLLRDLGELFHRFNRASDGTLVMECRYRQVIAVRRA